MLSRKRGIQQVVNDANVQLVVERDGRDAERTISLQRHVKLKEEALALKLRELSARTATRVLQAGKDTRALAENVAVLGLETALLKRRHALLAV